MPDDRTLRAIPRVAELIAKADALLITAGAGMGVDCGLPDFRGKDGFWRAYPALGKLGISFEEMAQPHVVRRPAGDGVGVLRPPAAAVSRDEAARRVTHAAATGARAMPAGYFVVTSNVDGHFEAAGFRGRADSRAARQHPSVPVHGALQRCDLAGRCAGSADRSRDDQARGTLPRCPSAGRWRGRTC